MTFDGTQNTMRQESLAAEIKVVSSDQSRTDIGFLHTTHCFISDLKKKKFAYVAWTSVELKILTHLLK